MCFSWNSGRPLVESTNHPLADCQGLHSFRQTNANWGQIFLCHLLRRHTKVWLRRLAADHGGPIQPVRSQSRDGSATFCSGTAKRGCGVSPRSVERVVEPFVLPHERSSTARRMRPRGRATSLSSVARSAEEDPTEPVHEEDESSILHPRHLDGISESPPRGCGTPSACLCGCAGVLPLSRTLSRGPRQRTGTCQNGLAVPRPRDSIRQSSRQGSRQRLGEPPPSAPTPASREGYPGSGMGPRRCRRRRRSISAGSRSRPPPRAG